MMRIVLMVVLGSREDIQESPVSFTHRHGYTICLRAIEASAYQNYKESLLVRMNLSGKKVL